MRSREGILTRGLLPMLIALVLTAKFTVARLSKSGKLAGVHFHSAQDIASSTGSATYVPHTMCALQLTEGDAQVRPECESQASMSGIQSHDRRNNYSRSGS
jgi:hypothetical protein